MFEETKEKKVLPEKPVPKEEKVPEIERELPPRPEMPEAKIEVPEREKPEVLPQEKPSRRILLHKKAVKILEKSKTFQEIENILSEDLEEAYQTMPKVLKERFRARGEETALKIEKIISKVKIVVNKILILIRNWLFMIPGFNRFFLEQQAKIKTDKILKLAEEKKKKQL